MAELSLAFTPTSPERQAGRGGDANSQEKYLKVFRSSPIALTLARMEDGVLVEANQAFEDITGYSLAEAIWENLARGLIFFGS